MTGRKYLGITPGIPSYSALLTFVRTWLTDHHHDKDDVLFVGAAAAAYLRDV